MADVTHLAKLLEGAAAWNQWRKDNPTIIPDLSGVDFTEDAFRNTALYERDENGHSKINLQGANLQGADLQYANLQDADLQDANLQGAFLADVIFEGAKLCQTNFQDAKLFEANLQGALFEEPNFQGADLYRANLQDAILGVPNLQGANLELANLKGADLSDANLQSANLYGANLQRAKLARANLQGANLSCANLQDANVTAVQFDRSSRQLDYRGIRVSTCYGSQAFKTFAQDQDYIEELRGSRRCGWLKFWVWYVLADCGRSFMVWAVWSSGLATMFGYIYYYWLGPTHFKLDHLTFDLFPMIYYSIVTFTTLGFGDVKPQTEFAALIVMVEVIFGYVMLGGLVSILANKLARRA